MAASKSIARVAAKWNAFYALAIYFPFSRLSHALRAARRVLRRVVDPRKPKPQLPNVSWRAVIRSRPILLIEPARSHGNVRLSELALLAKAAAAVTPGEEIIEIGTFDGRTTLNLALNSAPATRVFTLDLPAGAETKFSSMKGERRFVEKPLPGERFRNHSGPGRDCISKIVQLTGDSAVYDWSAHYGRAGLIFVDGSHAFEYAMHDSGEAFRLAAPNATIIWHDYGVWNGVTRALDELESTRRLGLRRIRGTSLVLWRASLNK
ncbi:MAG: hypothetical protein QOI04_213 [Verrucomicrobiota bacterium]|jgi:hypothetical protein